MNLTSGCCRTGKSSGFAFTFTSRRAERYVAMRLLIPMASCLVLIGCDGMLVSALDLFGVLEEVAILHTEPVRIGDAPIDYILSEPLPIEGGSFAVCLVLAENAGSGSMGDQEQLLNRLTNGAAVTVISKLSNGESEEATGVLYSWSRYGHVLPRDEFSGCVAVPCAHYEEVDLALTSVSITADKHFTARGIYAQQRQSIKQ